MKILFLIVILKVISADENNDNQFIETLPADVKKTLLDKISRRINEEVPEVDTGDAATDGEIIDAKFEEQSEFVKKILREEIDSLKARRKNEDDKLEVRLTDNNATVARSNGNLQHIDLTLRSQSKRTGEDDLNETQVSNNTADKEEAASVDNNENKDNTKENVPPNIQRQDGKNDHREITFQTEENSLASKQEEKLAKPLNENVKLNENIKRQDDTNDDREITFQSEENSLKDVASKQEEKINLKPDNDDKKLLRNEGTTASSNADKIKKINNTPDIERTTIKELPEKVINLTKRVTDNVKIDVKKEKSDIVIGKNKKIEVDRNIPKILNERNDLLLSNSSNEYLENNSPPKNLRTKVISIAQKVKETTKRDESSIVKQDLRNEDSRFATIPVRTETPYRATAFIKLISKITTPKQESNKMLNIRSNDNSALNMKSGTVIKKPCNKTKTLNGTKPDCDIKSSLTTEETTIPIKIILNPMRSILRSGTRQGSEEHFGDLRNRQEYQVFEIDENKSSFVQVAKTEEVEQPHYFPVYNYEPQNVYYNAENRFGPNIESERTDLRENLNGQRKHWSAEHFGDLHVSSGLQVFEENLNTQLVQENRDNVVEPQYYPVYNYDPKNIYYNAFNRLGPNDDDYENNVGDRNLEIEMESATVIDGKRMLERPELVNTYKRKRHVELHNEKNQKYENYKPKRILESSEAYHAYQVLKNGLKSNLKANRQILHRNRNVGSVSANHGRGLENEEDLGLRGDEKKTIWGNTYETDNEYDVNLNDDSSDSSEVTSNNNINTLIDFLVSLNGKGKQKEPMKVEWFSNENRVKTNGEAYDLKDMHYPGQKSHKLVENQMESKPLYSLVDPEKINYKSVKQVKHAENDIKNVYDSATRFIMTPATVNYFKKGKIKNEVEQERDHRKESIKWEPEAKADFRFRADTDEDSHSIEETVKEPYNVDTVEKIINITPEIDAISTLEELMLMEKVPLTRSNDDDDELETHLNILKDLVQLDSAGLESYDWLGTTVDIRAALTKLIDLVNRRNSYNYIHPADLQLLKYVEAILKNAQNMAHQTESENIPLPRPVYYNAQQNKRLPKYGKKIQNPLKVIFDKYKVRSQENLESFLYDLRDSLADFHTLLKHISSVTKYNHQRWYKNIKDLYLAKEGRKEYLDILLHLFSSRLFDLIEESLKNGAEDNYLTYMRKNRAEVDRTEAEMIFVLKILKTIKNLN